MAKKRKTFGNLPPKHTFFLNPYDNVRFTRCPKCDAKTKIRKRPFAIHVDPMHMIALNMSGPYCTHCDLIILHQDKVEGLLTQLFLQYAPDVIGNNYLIIGTIERKHWRKSNKQDGDVQEMRDHLHDFDEVVSFTVRPPGWYPKDDDD